MKYRKGLTLLFAALAAYGIVWAFIASQQDSYDPRLVGTVWRDARNDAILLKLERQGSCWYGTEKGGARYRWKTTSGRLWLTVLDEDTVPWVSGPYKLSADRRVLEYHIEGENPIRQFSGKFIRQ